MEILIFFIILMFSVILHEVAHGWVAEKLGDPTARLEGRITLNPISHIDPIGTILLPALFIISGTGFFIAWAKPVPVNPMYLKDGKKDMALVALSGPATNILIALIATISYHLLFPMNITVMEIVRMNLFLAFFNLIPIPPLDGSKVISILLSDEAALRFQSVGQMGIFLLLGLFYFTPLGEFVSYLPLQVMRYLGM